MEQEQAIEWVFTVVFDKSTIRALVFSGAQTADELLRARNVARQIADIFESAWVQQLQQPLAHLDVEGKVEGKIEGKIDL